MLNEEGALWGWGGGEKLGLWNWPGIQGVLQKSWEQQLGRWPSFAG